MHKHILIYITYSVIKKSGKTNIWSDHAAANARGEEERRFYKSNLLFKGRREGETLEEKPAGLNESFV